MDKDNPTRVGRALRQLGARRRLLARGPRARFGTLQKRLLQELRLAADMAEANRFLKQVYLPDHNGSGQLIRCVPVQNVLDMSRPRTEVRAAPLAGPRGAPCGSFRSTLGAASPFAVEKP